MTNAKRTININGVDVSVLDNQFISILDLAKTISNEPSTVIGNWMRVKETLMYLKAWEIMNNEDFKQVKTDKFKGYEEIEKEFMVNPFIMNPSKWISYTNSIAFVVKQGRGGGIWAHSDVALTFVNWLSPKFHLYTNMELQRLKEEELSHLGDSRNLKKNTGGNNFQLMMERVFKHMDENLLRHPQPYKKRLQVAPKMEFLNKLVFGKTTEEWRLEYPEASTDNNQRDYANVIELAVIRNLEFLNTKFMSWEMNQTEREQILKEMSEWLFDTFQDHPIMQKIQDLATH